ncbi:MAG: ribosome maturation factor RimM [Clostridia bacterium]|nr:ribosome maturation factor RimM [Clostridia bacterium]
MMLLIAEVLKPQGIKGELKLKSYLDNFADYHTVKEVVINDKPIPVESIRSDAHFAYIKLNGIADRNTAETLRGAKVYADASNRPRLAKGRHYIADIIGCSIVAGGEELGVVDEILQNGSADVYRITGKRPFLFALVDGVITDIDIANKTLTADPAELAKVAVYED